MQAANRFQRTLQAGLSLGHWQQYAGANISRTLAQSGVDWVCIDCEHGEIGDTEMHASVPAIAALGVSPVVRVPANEAWMVKRALDAGAHGILIPLLYTADDARKVVSAAKFPPAGTRGFGSSFPHACFGVASSAYLAEANDAIVTVVQIETREALEAVDEIARVPGVDVLLVGPNDLGINIGHRMGADGTMPDALAAAVDSIHEAAVRNGKRSGIFCANGEQANVYVKKGFHMVTVAADAMVLPATLARQMKSARA